MADLTRRTLMAGTLATGALLATRRAAAAPRLQRVYAQIEPQHDANVARLQQWIGVQSIAAENLGLEEGCAAMIELAREAGFQHAERIATDGPPVCFATLDAGARRTVGLYFMYDVKQVDPAEWSSPPWDASLVDFPDVGKVVMGRAAVNQKGPQTACLAALHAIRAAGGQPPVNLVLVAEGEEEIGSVHLSQALGVPRVHAALASCLGIFMPSAEQERDGTVQITLGGKGVTELEITCSGERWGQGPTKDIHSGNRARVDSPAFRLVQALATLVDAAGEPAIDGFWDTVRPLTNVQRAMLDEAAAKMDEATIMDALGVRRWARGADWRRSLEDLASRPTVNIEGMVAGYTGPGGMTILPHRASAKLDIRLVPDMSSTDIMAKLRAHLDRRGYADLEIQELGASYEPTTTPADSELIRAQRAVYRSHGIEPLLWPLSAGSWPGAAFTGAPLQLPAGHFGLGHGGRAHAPDEYYLIESTNPMLAGFDDAVRSFVDYFYELA
jgi:acetylornithine deacetylase/succinyl-diaminopimelate desuccinylase-like protein